MTLILAAQSSLASRLQNLHKLYRDRDSLDYGRELDVAATYYITENIDLRARHTRRDADEYSCATDRF
ncbi:hypothetical protein GNX18_09760 [Microbulbifer sp. SH-1]|uniref:hypothetical protein n=1 Tax=Microbulbifer sp. SH-1 TaxID=2681547 RepID=UPI00140CC887|nr:hypothetical protein [Microbulbifer sp. SH-1]QIL90007.1 hypothetical protein GNX18_09760 [Microbulbifer sp. SH-1]